MSYILLTSAKQDIQATRSFNEFETRDELAHTIIGYFEEYLQAEGARKEGEEADDGKAGLEYTSDDLFEFMDEFFGEMVCLEKQEDQPDLWIPFSTSWVKEAIYLSFRSEYEAQAKKTKEKDMEVDDCAILSC